MPTSPTGADHDPALGAREAGGRRRWTGITVLACLLVVVIVLAAVHGRRLPGDPRAAPIPGTPQIGDCVQEDPYDPGRDLYPGAAPLPALRIGGCSERRYGEVVSVTDGHLDGTEIPAAAVRQCLEQAFGYLGLPTPPPAPALPVGPAVSVWYVLVGPNDRQQASGQHWTACAVALPISTDPAAPTTIDHSLHDAWTRPDDSRLFGQCLDQVGQVATNCRSPHRFEVISRRPGDPESSPLSLQDACTQDAVQALGSPTALNRGELSVLAVAAPPDPTGDGLSTGPGAVTPGADYVTNCLISPSDTSRMLTDSVRGLKEAPAPLN
jgi:hypothetical protein